MPLWLACILLLLTAGTISAQYTFKATTHTQGTCKTNSSTDLYGLEGAISKAIFEAEGNNMNNTVFPTRMDCESARNYAIHSGGNYENCKIWVTASPCIAIGSAIIPDGSVAYNLSGVDNGMPSFVTNPARETEQWEEEYKKKMKSIHGEDWDKEIIQSLLTGDGDFDGWLNDMYTQTGQEINQWQAQSISRPHDSREIIKESSFYLDDYIKNGKPFVSLNERYGGSSTISSSDFIFDYDLSRQAEIKWVDTAPEKGKSWVDWSKDMLSSAAGLALDIAELGEYTFGFAEKVLIDANISLYTELVNCAINGCISTNEIFKKAWNIDFAEGVIWGVDVKEVVKKLAEYGPNFAGQNAFIPDALVESNPAVILSEEMYDKSSSGQLIHLNDAERSYEYVGGKIKSKVEKKSMEYLVNNYVSETADSPFAKKFLKRASVLKSSFKAIKTLTEMPSFRKGEDE